MADAKFARCQAVTAKWEGGWSNHAADPGGKTMYGITEAVYHAWLRKKSRAVRPVRSISRAEAEEIYFEQYWVPSGGPTLFDGVDLATYDASVNSGVSRGRKWLLAGLDPKNDHAQTVKNICRQRLSFVQGLSTWKVFGRGWGNRIADIQAKGVAWAVTAMSSPEQARERLEAEAEDAEREAQRHAAGAGASGGGAVGAGGATQLDAGLDWRILAVIVFVALIGAGLLFVRSRQKLAQANAYLAEADRL